MKKSFLFLILFVLASCAQKEIIIKSSDTKVLRAYDQTTPISKYKGNVSVLKFSDQRENKNNIGIAYTGMLNKETPIYLDTPIEQFLKERFTTNIGKRGIETASTTPYGFRATIKKLWVNEITPVFAAETSNCVVDLEFEIVASKTKQPVYRGNISVQGSGTNMILDTTDSNGPTLEVCMNLIADHFLKNPDMQKILGIKQL